jgi:peptide/nickel transport system permease protein
MAQTEDDKVLVPAGGAGLGAAVAIESGTELGEIEDVKARGYWELVWRRFRRDRVAVASGIFIICLVLVAIFGGPIAAHFLGHGPNDVNQAAGGLTGAGTGIPVGPWTHVKCADFGILPSGCHGKGSTVQLYILGGADPLGEDEFLRILYGARVSLEVAVLASIGVMFIGVILGTIAGYFRGWADTLISRVIELTMVFPALLFIVALSATVGPRINHITFGIFAPGVLTLVFVFAIFGWYYPARIMRAQVLSLREKEFVEAARMVGASDGRIMRSHIVPHLVAPIIVYSTLTIAQYILLEAGLSFLGLGIDPATASWGNLLSTAPQFYLTQPWLMVWPGLAILMTTLAFNLLGDGLRDAFDPRGGR